MTPKQLIESLELCIQHSKLTPIILGSPGIGKTQIIKQLAKKLGRKLHLSHPTTDDPVDYKGMPWFNTEKKFAQFFPIGVVQSVLSETEPAIWFIDDIGMAPTSVESAILQLVDPYGRQLNDVTVPDNVQIILASNRKEDRAASSTPIEPFKSRTIPLSLEVSLKDWVSWATKFGIDNSIVSFLSWRGELLNKFNPTDNWDISPSPRGWEHANNVLKMNIQDQDTLNEWLSGAVGVGAATEYLAFLQMYKQVPTRSQIQADPDGVQVPEQSSVIYASVAYLAGTTTAGNLKETLTYLKRFPGEMQMLWTEMVAEKRENKEIVETSEFTNWAIAVGRLD